jgi:ABC-type sugar transport system permease subunit
MSDTLSASRTARPTGRRADQEPPVRRSARLGPRITPYLFISPFYLLYGLFLVVPIVVGAYLSFTEWGGFGSPQWVGLANFERLFSDADFYQSLRNTTIYVALSVGVIVPASLLIAQALNARGLRGRDMFRLIYFTPVVLSPIIIALVFQLLYDRNFGLFNAVLKAVFGFGGIDWLGDPTWAKISVSILVMWRWTGYLTIFFLAGLQGVPRELYEAAEVDGANAVSRFWHVTLPSLRPVTAFVVVVVLVGAAQIFEEPYLLTAGGPDGATMSVAQFVYRAAFQRQEIGYAAASGFTLFVIVFVLGRLANWTLGVGRSK